MEATCPPSRRTDVHSSTTLPTARKWYSTFSADQVCGCSDCLTDSHCRTRVYGGADDAGRRRGGHWDADDAEKDYDVSLSPIDCKLSFLSQRAIDMYGIERRRLYRRELRFPLCTRHNDMEPTQTHPMTCPYSGRQTTTVKARNLTLTVITHHYLYVLLTLNINIT